MINNDYKKIDGGSTSKNGDYPQKIALVVMFILTVIFNALTAAGKLGKSQKYLSDKYPTLLTPPSYAFSIWGVIYFFWAASVLLQLAPNRFLSQPKLFYEVSLRGKFFQPFLILKEFGCGFVLLFFSTVFGVSLLLKIQKLE